MRFVRYSSHGVEGLAVENESTGHYYGKLINDESFPGDLHSLIAAGSDALHAAAKVLSGGENMNTETIEFLPPIANPGKIICVGLNYHDHSAESGFEPPAVPTIFSRFPSSLIGHDKAIIRPRESGELDYEAELAVIIGKAGRRIAPDNALDHVAGYSIFNDATVRDYQLRTTQWTIGKNFDATGAFGPSFVTADALPKGCSGLEISTRLNGEVLQHANTDQLIFDVKTLVSYLSEAMTLEPGDVIITGTPGGVGMARKPPVWMKAGDVVEIEIEQLGVLRNRVESD